MKFILSFSRKWESLKLVFSLLILLASEISFAQLDSLNLVDKGILVIKITGFESDVGECWFGLDNSEEVFESKDTVFIGKILPIVNREVNLTIENVAYGNYAIRVFHDENSNGKLDTNFLGIPTENYGYSNNASGWFGPPSWEKAVFQLDEIKMTIEILVD